MSQRTLFLTTVLAVTALSAAVAMAEPKAWTASSDRFGPLKFGMSYSEAFRALRSETGDGAQAAPDAPSVSCLELPVPSQIDAVMMFENDRLTRVTFYGDSPVLTTLGIGLGATESEVMAKYPTALASKRLNVAAPAADLTYWLKFNITGIRFKTNDKREVDTVLVGAQSITYAGGCA